jgi:hypothetical protein
MVKAGGKPNAYPIFVSSVRPFFSGCTRPDHCWPDDNLLIHGGLCMQGHALTDASPRSGIGRHRSRRSLTTICSSWWGSPASMAISKSELSAGGEVGRPLQLGFGQLGRVYLALPIAAKILCSQQRRTHQFSGVCLV